MALPRRLADDEDLLYPRPTASRTRSNRSGTVKTKRAPASAELGRHLLGGEERVEHRRRAAERGGGVEGDRELRDARADGGQDVALAEAAMGEANGSTADAVSELPIRQCAAAWAIDERRLVSQLAGSAQYEGRE